MLFINLNVWVSHAPMPTSDTLEDTCLKDVMRNIWTFALRVNQKWKITCVNALAASSMTCPMVISLSCAAAEVIFLQSFLKHLPSNASALPLISNFLRKALPRYFMYGSSCLLNCPLLLNCHTVIITVFLAIDLIISLFSNLFLILQMYLPW